MLASVACFGAPCVVSARWHLLRCTRSCFFSGLYICFCPRHYCGCEYTPFIGNIPAYCFWSIIGAFQVVRSPRFDPWLEAWLQRQIRTIQSSNYTYCVDEDLCAGSWLRPFFVRVIQTCFLTFRRDPPVDSDRSASPWSLFHNLTKWSTVVIRSTYRLIRISGRYGEE